MPNRLRSLVSCSHLLTVDLGLFLPHFKSVNIYWMKAILSKQRKALSTAEVKHIFAPQYPALSIAKLLEFAA